MRLWSTCDTHRHDCFTKSILDGDLSSCMFSRVKSVKLLEFVFKLTRHCNWVFFECWPISSLQALDRKLKIAILSLGLSSSLWLKVREFLWFFFYSDVVCKHTLHLVHLLHTTDKLQSSDHMPFQFKIFIGLLQKSSGQMVAIYQQKQVFVE